MQKKIGEISQAFEQLRFTEALAIIDQTLKKNSKQDKKQKQLSSLELKVIQCFKVGSLVSLGRHHEAGPAYQELISPEGISIMGKQNPYLFVAISQLFGENKEKEVIELLQKHVPAFDNSKIYRFYLNVRLFSTLSKLFMKQFTVTKNNMCQLDQAYCQYLSQINKFNLIQYQRDGWYKYHPDIKASLKLVSMFAQRCLKSSEEARVKIQNDLLKENLIEKEKLTAELEKNIKIGQRSNELRLKIAINEGRVADAISIYNSLRSTLKLPFTFMRSILRLSEVSEDKEAITRFYIKQMSGIFRTNLDFSTYTPLYDYYHEFFLFLKEKAPADNIQQSVTIEQPHLPLQQLYNFDNLSTVQVLRRYYNSLISEYSYLVDASNPKYAQNKKSDYYRICIKGLLLQIIEVSQFLNSEQTKLNYLKQYTKYFLPTLTYSQELKKYWPELITNAILVQPEEVTNDNQLISEINFVKVSIAVATTSTTDTHQLFSHYDDLIKVYRLRVNEVEKNRKLEKGERYISDEFLIILADYIRAFLEHEQQAGIAEQIISKIVSDLEYCVEVSSYNADLKLRLMYFLSLLNHHERLIEVYITNDIKSVQMETLGYWFLKAAIEFGIQSKYDHFLERMIKSYHQNQRQTSEYGLKALKAGELDRVEEYLAYRSNVLNSYNSIVILFMLFHRYRFDSNSHYYLLRVNERINSFKNKQTQLSFNADFKVMHNILFPEYRFADLYGLYNNYELLQQEVNVYLHEQFLITQLLERSNDIALESIEPLDKLDLRISAFEATALFDFSSYAFQEEQPHCSPHNSKQSLERSGKMLDIFKLLMAIRISNIRLATLLASSIKTHTLNQEEANALQAIILDNIEKLKNFHKSIGYRAQIRSVVMIRRSLFECHNILSAIRETVAKNKKLKAVKAAIEGATGKLMEEYYQSILSFKWSEKPPLSLGLVARRDQVLERQLQMDGKQAKRIISRYQNAYKV